MTASFFYKILNKIKRLRMIKQITYQMLELSFRKVVIR